MAASEKDESDDEMDEENKQGIVRLLIDAGARTIDLKENLKEKE